VSTCRGAYCLIPFKSRLYMFLLSKKFWYS
jgi:hypothetical protein